MAWFPISDHSGQKIGVRGIGKTGKEITLLNPNGKGKKYANELKYGYAKTNTLDTKRTQEGKAIALTDTQKAFRSGYLQARKDNARAFAYK